MSSTCLYCNDRGLIELNRCTCGTGGSIYGIHEPICSLEPCEDCNIWWLMTFEEKGKALDDQYYIWPEIRKTK